MEVFQFADPAELYVANGYKGRRFNMSYRRFVSAAEAIRYVMEELSPSRIVGTVLEVNEQRHQHREIRALYESDAYPFMRVGERT